MGADLKRKEARKRKFGGHNSQSPPDTGAHLDLGRTSVWLDSKKATQVSPPTSSETSRAVKIAARDSTVVDDSMSLGRGQSVTQKSKRFIVFIGNLPFTATDESIRRHFAKVNPVSIRHRKEKNLGKSKGFAFLEFEKYDRMKTCLEFYHQSNFEDGESPARKLNVELTAGGGGRKSEDRKGKLRAKNQKLNEQRQRRKPEEENQNNIPRFDYRHTHASTNSGSIHPSRKTRIATDQHESYA